jgi:hypothetical protein
MSRVDWQTSAFHNGIDDGEHIGEIEIWVETLRVAIQGEGDKIDVARPLSVSEDGALDSVCTGEHSEFSSCHSTTCIRI